MPTSDTRPADKSIFLNGPGAQLAKRKIGNKSPKWSGERDSEVLQRSEELVPSWPAFFKRRAQEQQARKEKK